MKSPQRLWWDLLTTSLFLAAILISTGRLVITRWIPNLDTVQTVAVLGSILGLALGYSVFKKQHLALLVAGYSLLLLPWQLSLTIENLDALARLLTIGDRLMLSVVELLGQRPVKDPIFLISVLALLYWVVGLVSGYYLTRHKHLPWASLPAGLALLIVHNFDGGASNRIWFVGIYLLVILLIQARLNYITKKIDWNQKRVITRTESSARLITAAVIFTTLLFFFSWTLPASAASVQAFQENWERLTRPWREFRSELSDAFAAIEYRVPVVRDNDFYENILSLGMGNPLGDEMMFTVFISSPSQALPRYYWRGYTYDTFDGKRWLATAEQSFAFSPSNKKLDIPHANGLPNSNFIFTTFINQQQLLYTPAQPVWGSRPVQISYFTTKNGEFDTTAWNAINWLTSGDTYMVGAALANPTVLALQQAGEDYPSWVLEHYLQLPANTPASIRALAAEITEGLETPYDKASAITQYLRENIRYVDRLTIPPPENNAIEWMLFTSKQGFCNYYATAQVLLLRSIGIPSRMVVGFSQGEVNEKGLLFTVRQNNAHAWPEVYFPDIGWVEFEPTGNQEPLTRPEAPEPESEATPEIGQPDQAVEQANQPEIPLLDELLEPPDVTSSTPSALPFNWRPVFIALGSLFGILAGFLLWQANDRYHLVERFPVALKTTLEKNQITPPSWLERWAFIVQLNPIARSFRVIPRSLKQLNYQAKDTQTPKELGVALQQLLPTASEDIELLLQEYELSAYSSAPGNIATARQASVRITQAAFRAMVHNIWNQVKSPFPSPEKRS